MRISAVILATAASLSLGACSTWDDDSTRRTGTSAAVGAASGALIGAVTGNSVGSSAAVGAIVGGAGGYLYDQREKDQGN